MGVKTKHLKMAEDHEKGILSMWYHDIQSLILARRRYRREFGRNPPSEKTIGSWYQNLSQTGHVNGLVKKGRKPISVENINRV